MYIFAAVSADRQRLMDAEAEFLGLLKAVRQQKCRMSPLSTTRNPYRRHKRILAKTAAFRPRSSNFYMSLEKTPIYTSARNTSYSHQM